MSEEPFLPAHKGSASIVHNSHKNNYQTVAEMEENQPEWFKGAWVSEESRAFAIANDELWELQWYPETPIGFHNLCAGRWSDIIEYLKREG